MKHIILSYFFFLLCYHNIADGQTNANIPGPENVLVVYNRNVALSDSIMHYYVNARGIPYPTNVVELDLPRKPISVGDWSDPHIVKLGFDDQNIVDSTWAKWDSTHCVDTAKFHAWQYFIEEVANPIRTHLVNNNLTETIRYIVMCQGVPYKIQAVGDWSVPGNISIDGLLAMLNTPNYDDFVEAIFNAYTTQCYASCDPSAPDCYSIPFISNPYFNQDPDYQMNARFLPDHYTGTWNGWNYKLSYLVSRLDGLSYEIITDIIDKSVNADKSGEKTWILDGGGPGSGDITEAYNKLNYLGFSTKYNNNITEWITTSLDSVIGYTSAGVHQGMPITYIQDTLDFNYANGAIFNTYESYNGWSIGTIRPRVQGLMTEFLLMGGTGGAGHVWEPFTTGVIKDNIYFPYYAIGYNQIDAAYQGMSMLAWRNVIVGDPLTRIYNYETITVTSDTTITGGDFVGRIIVPEGKTLTIAGGLAFNLKRNSNIIVNGSLIIESNNTLILSGYSKINLTANGFLYVGDNAALVLNGNSLVNSKGEIAVGFNSSLSFFNNSKFISEGVLNILAGTEIIKKYNSELRFSGIFVSIGTANNRIIFNGSDSIADIIFDKIDSLKITNCSFINSVLNIHSSRNRIHFLEITDNNFHYTIDVIRPLIFLDIDKDLNDVDALISNNNFNNFSNVGINAVGVRNLTIDSCNFVSDAINGIAVKINEIKNLNIRNSYFNTLKGIYIIKNSDEALTVNRDQNITIKNCNFLCPITELPVYSVSFATANNDLSISSLKIENCSFTGYNECVYLLNLNNLNPLIRNNSFFDFKSFGINAANGNGIRIINNQFNSSSQISSLQKTGIFLSQISYPHIISNNLSLQQQNIPGAGISLISCNGEIRGNSISGFKYGIELGSSSPNIGANVLTSNTENGIYVGAYSNPNLSYTIINDDVYPVSGYNTIRENGLCNFFPSYSEIYLSNSNIQLKGGCNTIADDREDPALHCNYLYLIDGDHIEETIYAAENYWGEINNHNPEGRFGENITVEYEGYLNEPCNYSSGSEILLLTDQNGEVFDTVYSSMNNISQLSDIETRYAMANSYFYAKAFTQAKNKYENIIGLYGTLRNSLKAYLRLYEIATITNSAPDEFNQLHQFYLLKASIQTDSIMIGVLKHLSSLCFVWSKNYEEALARFESDIQNASNNDIALYRMIDILTTSLLIEPDTLVGKRAAGYLTTSTNSSYSEIISELLSTRGKSAANERIKIIPKQFSLYQNFPNPFNPGTTISFDLPTSTQLTLTIYDILGRKIKTVVDERKEAGSYSINVDLGNLSSGVYFYHLQTDDFNATRKMVLLR